ncbi:hypothetical protein [Ralstonia pseudosolanacearum]
MAILPRPDAMAQRYRALKNCFILIPEIALLSAANNSIEFWALFIFCRFLSIKINQCGLSPAIFLSPAACH